MRAILAMESGTTTHDSVDEAVATGKSQAIEGEVFGVKTRHTKFFIKRGGVAYPISASAAATFAGVR